MKSYTFTYINMEGLSNRQKCNRMMKALEALSGDPQGTINEPCEDADTRMSDGRTLIQTLKEDGEVKFYDDYLCIECDDNILYVDYSTKVISEWEMEDWVRVENVDRKLLQDE